MYQKKSSKKSNFKVLKSILLKDIKSELRQINDIFSVFLFDVISIFIFASAYNYSTQNQAMPIEIFVIEIWLTIFFTLIFIMTKLFIKEKEAGTLGGLLSSPISANIILMAKVLFCFLLLTIVEVVLFLFGYFISMPAIKNLEIFGLVNYILLGIMLPTLDLSVCGSIVSAFSMYVKNKSFVLPILLFPIILPIVSPIISLNLKLLQGELFFDVILEFIFLLSHAFLMFSILILISEALLYE